MPERYEVDSVVIGAGVVGLAVARELAQRGREVVIVERNAAIGEEGSARNSEVIHAGIYYPPGSLKALTCVAGRDMLYRYCGERGIGHARLGKLIVAANDEQARRLLDIRDHAHRNGVAGVRWLEAGEARRLEPELRCAGALMSPDTGIVDSHALMLSLLGDAEAGGAALSLGTPVMDLTVRGGQIDVACGGAAPCVLGARHVVNSAGLAAPQLAARLWPGAPKSSERFARGNYFSLAGTRSPFSRLVYPVPEPGGLGVHFTTDLGGRAKFGPDVEWTETLDYEVNAGRAALFYERIREYWPGLPDGALVPDYAGVRPKVLSQGKMESDFVIAGPAEHGTAGVVHLLGIESPGLTACMAIARLVAARLGL